MRSLFLQIISLYSFKVCILIKFGGTLLFPYDFLFFCVAVFLGLMSLLIRFSKLDISFDDDDDGLSIVEYMDDLDCVDILLDKEIGWFVCMVNDEIDGTMEPKTARIKYA